MDYDMIILQYQYFKSELLIILREYFIAKLCENKCVKRENYLQVCMTGKSF
jgi:hypothetical protein